jgi:hypothetical protein
MSESVNNVRLSSESKASFRVLGHQLDLEGLSRSLAISPTRTHREGDPDILKQPFSHDMWTLESPLTRDHEIEEHLRWLHNKLRPHLDHLKSLREKADLSVLCNYRCYDTDQGGFTLSPEALSMSCELGVRMEFHLLSI